MTTPTSETIRGCRSCGGTQLEEVIDLGTTPLANGLLDAPQLDQHEPCFPLRVVFCPDCALVQITETVPPELLFRDYVYFSSFSDALVEHSRRHAEELIASRGLGPDHRVVEIASNDGYLLQFFQRAGVEVLGIEPARNVAAVAQEKGIPTRAEFFGLETAERLVAEGLGADVVLGNNVLAHVSDLNGLVAGICMLLRPGGVAELEFPYVSDLVDGVEFDTVYHEHLCYFSLHAIEALFARHGLALADVHHQPVHGGSLRIRAGREAAAGDGARRVEAMLSEERRRGIDEIQFYSDFATRVRGLQETLVGTLRKLKADGARIVAYGASAKGSTLLNCFGIGADLLDYVVDRSTMKQGRYTPGTHLPIRAPEALLADQPEYALLLTWNFADEILDQQQEYRSRGGRFVLPVPEVRIV